jgi:hypothetical protein
MTLESGDGPGKIYHDLSEMILKRSQGRREELRAGRGYFQK